VRLLVSEPHEFVDQIRAPPSAAHFDLKLIVRARSGQGRLIGPDRRERIEDVDDTRDLSDERNRVAIEPIRISASVERSWW